MANDGISVVITNTPISATIVEQSIIAAPGIGAINEQVVIRLGLKVVAGRSDITARSTRPKIRPSQSSTRRRR